MDYEALRRLAKKIRLHGLRMTSQSGASHIGSVFSVADIVAVLYGHVLRLEPSTPRWSLRDRFILSKGHAAAAVYAALAERGFFAPEELHTYGHNGSRLGGHVSHGVPGVELSTGSLGHGLCVAAGMALAAHLDGRESRMFVLLSDGECDEGAVWEAALFASHHALEKLTVIVDYNKLQSLSAVEETLALEPFAQKWSAFGWAVREVDGHDVAQLKAVLSALPAAPSQPTCVIAHTVKGKGVSFMEGSVLWHYRTAQGDEYEAALKELTEAG